MKKYFRYINKIFLNINSALRNAVQNVVYYKTQSMCQVIMTSLIMYRTFMLHVMFLI